MPQPRKKMTPVEWMIALAILGIVLSIVGGPRGRRSSHRPAARPTPRVSTEGRGNTIQAPESRRQQRHEAVPIGNAFLRGLLRLVVTIGIFVLLPLLLRRRRGRRSPYRPPQHEHPPDVEE